MELRIAVATEHALAECVRHRCWAVRKKLGRGWRDGQLVLVRIGDECAGLGRICSEMRPEIAPEALRNRFYYAAAASWVWYESKGVERIPFGDWIREPIIKAWGPHYGFRVLNQTSLPGRQARRVFRELAKRLDYDPGELEKLISG